MDASVEVQALTNEVVRLSQLGSLEKVHLLSKRQMYLRQKYEVTSEDMRNANTEGLTLIQYTEDTNLKQEPIMMEQLSCTLYSGISITKRGHSKTTIRFFQTVQRH